MKYTFQVILIIIVFFASWMAKRQFRKSMEKGIYNIGIYRMLKPLSGEKAMRMATRGLFMAQIAPWVFIAVLLLYNLL